jgi:hypothetical protein
MKLFGVVCICLAALVSCANSFIISPNILRPSSIGMYSRTVDGILIFFSNSCISLNKNKIEANKIVCAFDPATTKKCQNTVTVTDEDTCTNDAVIICSANEIIKIHKGIIGLKDSKLCPTSVTVLPSSVANWCDETLETTRILKEM